MQDKCDALVCVCVSHCACACLFRCASVFVCKFALAFLSKCFCVQICHTTRPCVYVCVYLCVCVFMRTHDEHVVPAEEKWQCRTMCHNYALGVTVKTALKPEEVVFTSINIQIEHHIGVSYPPLSLSLSPSPVAVLPMSVTSCVCLWLCASMVNVCSVCPHFFLLLQICWNGGGCNRSRPGKKVSVLLINERETQESEIKER